MHHTTELLKLTLAALSLGRLGKQSFAGNVSERLVKPFFGIKKTNGRKCHSFFFLLWSYGRFLLRIQTASALVADGFVMQFELT